MSSPRKILLTGAGSGIGREVARRLAARGDELWLVVRSAERASAIEDEYGAGAHVLVADLADPAALTGVLGWPEELDGVVHAAGVVELGPVAELSVDDWQAQLTVNLVAPAVLTRVLLPALRAARGTVVFVNSGSGLRAAPDWSAYAASKHGLRALADSLRAEEPALRVTSVFPGRTATPMQEKVHAHERAEYDAERWIQAGTVADVVLSALDLPRDAQMPEVVVRPA